MSSEGIMGFLSLNRSLTNLGDESRRFRLPRMNPFPKLDGRVVRQPAPSASQRAPRGGLILGGLAGSLPEMATDVIDQSANYAAENIKRDRSGARSLSGAGLGHLMGRMLGSRRAARP